jgi:hypothetical protein
MKNIRLPFPAVFAINGFAIASGTHYKNNWILAIGIVVILFEICVLLLANPIGEIDKWLAFKLNRLSIKLVRNPNKKAKYDQKDKKYREEANRRVRPLEPYTTTLNVAIVLGTLFNVLFSLTHVFFS